MKPYRWAFEESALASLLTLSSRRAQSMVGHVDFLAAHPFHRGHLVYRDARGREILVLFVDDWELHYHLDHAVRELRIAELRPDSFSSQA